MQSPFTIVVWHIKISSDTLNPYYDLNRAIDLALEEAIPDRDEVLRLLE